MKAEWTNNDSLTTSQTTKAILVIDMPTDCIKCPLANGYCWNVFPIKGKADGCPLKPLPERLPEVSGNIRYFGWNACLEKITGETK